MRKKAIITGIAGQDGGFLAELLIKKGYEVIGADRRRVDTEYSRLWFRNFGQYCFTYFDLMEQNNINNLIEKDNPMNFIILQHKVL